MADVGRVLLVFGILLAVIGGGLMLFGRFHLPGDITFKSGNVTVYIPIATSIVLSRSSSPWFSTCCSGNASRAHSLTRSGTGATLHAFPSQDSSFPVRSEEHT